jgi:tRNA pseudouridine 55 synthase
MVNGILSVYKEKGYTSHDVVAKLRGIVGQRKIGHTGTLDPDAEGVLPVCLGKATKLCDLLTDKSKEYETVLLLGIETDTQDITGEVLNRVETTELIETAKLNAEMVQTCIEGFLGNYSQIPPMYSALKVNGKKLYELAREGKSIERKPREVQVYGIEIIEMKLPRVRMRVRCSKGTYIRTLCHDIGQRLHCGGCMEELMRTRVGTFTLNDALTLTEIEQYKSKNQIEEITTPVDAMFETYQRVNVSGEKMRRVYNGNTFEQPDMHCIDEELVRVYDEQGEFVALYKYLEEKQTFKAYKMFL